MNSLNEKYKRITEILIKRGITISTMESCTSGLVACLLTDTEGASAVVKGAFITYCNEAKIMCGVPAEIISECGVYSRETADEMAEAAREHFTSDIGIGITGTFGNVDAANGDSVPGKIFYAISYGEDIYEYELVLEMGLTRREYKNVVAEDVADELLKLLGENMVTNATTNADVNAKKPEKIYTIDCSKINDRETAHDYLKEVFGFPEYYGKNLDALSDCLSEMRNVSVKFENREMLSDYGHRIVEVITAETGGTF